MKENRHYSLSSEQPYKEAKLHSHRPVHGFEQEIYCQGLNQLDMGRVIVGGFEN